MPGTDDSRRELLGGSDPFGHGFCILQFTERGYDALVTPSPDGPSS